HRAPGNQNKRQGRWSVKQLRIDGSVVGVCHLPISPKRLGRRFSRGPSFLSRGAEPVVDQVDGGHERVFQQHRVPAINRIALSPESGLRKLPPRPVALERLERTRGWFLPVRVLLARAGVCLPTAGV